LYYLCECMVKVRLYFVYFFGMFMDFNGCPWISKDFVVFQWSSMDWNEIRSKSICFRYVKGFSSSGALHIHSVSSKLSESIRKTPY
jgi:hypothetical protein